MNYGRLESPHAAALAFSIPALVFMAALLFGCATPAPLYRLDPRTADVVWVGGRASLQQERDGVRVAVAFEHQQGDHLVLRVEVQNQTEQRLEVGPQKIWYSACSSIGTGSCQTAERVVNPEAMIAAIDEKQSADRAAAANSQAAHGALVMLSVVGDAASMASGQGDASQTLSAANSMELDASRRSHKAASLHEQRVVWSNEALRRNSLFPGQGTSGLVFVPIYPDAQFVWVQLRVGTQKFAFHFQQSVREVQAGGSHRRARESS